MRYRDRSWKERELRAELQSEDRSWRNQQQMREIHRRRTQIQLERLNQKSQ